MSRKQSFGEVSKLPSGNWRARYRDPRPNQSRARINAPHTFATKRAAEAWLAQVRADIDRGVWRHPDEIVAEQATEKAAALTVNRWAEQWLERLRKDGRAQSTIVSYASTPSSFNGRRILGSVELESAPPRPGTLPGRTRAVFRRAAEHDLKVGERRERPARSYEHRLVLR